MHLIVVRNLAHSGNPHDQARSSAVCPFLLHKLSLRQKKKSVQVKVDSCLAFLKYISNKGALGSYKWLQNKRGKGSIEEFHVCSLFVLN